MNLLEMLQKLKEAGAAPKLDSDQLVQMGLEPKDVDSTPSPSRAPSSPDVPAPELSPKELGKIRTKQIVEAFDAGDESEVLRLRKQYRDELDKLNSLVK